MDIEMYCGYLRAAALKNEKRGHRAVDDLADTIPEVAAMGVTSELTGVMPAGLNHGREIEEYRDLFSNYKG